MTAACALLALALAPARAQWPEDARALLAWHAEREAVAAVAPPDAAALRDRLYAYVRAGAEGEAWAAAAQLEAAAPGDPDGWRYRVQMSAWDPARWESGAELARGWLAAHAGRPESEAGSVRATLAHLERLVASRERARATQRARAWLPAAAAVGLLGLAAWLLRRAGGLPRA